MDQTLVTISLGLVFVLVLALPFISRKVEHNLELFLFTMGLIAATTSAVWSWHLIEEALVEPIKITLAVLFAGLIFHYFRHHIRAGVRWAIEAVSFRFFVFILVVLLGLLSSVISVIVAALILVEVASAMDMERKAVIRFVIIGCFALGLGAVLTPIGEPLSTIAIAKLKAEPYNADFFFLARLLGKFIVPGVVAMGALAVVLVGPHRHHKPELTAPESQERLVHVATRAGKVYIFVMALILLGTGFRPLIDLYLIHIPPMGLYWVNLASAILDNATLAAAELGPKLTKLQIEAALLSLVISGGALIPGNIPNIISAGKLKIKSSEWARIGVPVALATLVIYLPLIFFL